MYYLNTTVFNTKIFALTPVYSDNVKVALKKKFWLHKLIEIDIRYTVHNHMYIVRSSHLNFDW